MSKRWLLGVALAGVLPFTMVACGDDDDDDSVRDDLAEAGETVRDAAGEAASNVAGIAPVAVDLEEKDGSGVSGDSVLTPGGSDRSRVTTNLAVVGGDEDRSFQGGVWSGHCDGVEGDPEFDLGEVDDGPNTEAIDIGIQELKDGGYVIAVVDGSTVAACGAID